MIVYIGTNTLAGNAAQHLPCLNECVKRFPLPICSCHHNGKHINVADRFLIPIEPARIQKLLQITSDTQPFDRRRQNYPFCLPQRFRENRNPPFIFIQIVSFHTYMKFIQNLRNFINRIQSRIIDQTSSAIINIYSHSAFCPFLFLQKLFITHMITQISIPLTNPPAWAAPSISGA